LKNGTRHSGRPVKVHVAAFGKHPGWDDHIEEIGLDCPQLVKAKRVLYTECIGGNIDSGEWEKLEEGKRIPFRHEFVWSLPDGVMVGRLWASRDGKGRTKYPMVVCAFLENAPLDWACAQVLPRLAQVETDCTQTNSAELVRFAVGGCQSELEKAAEAYNAAPAPEEVVGDLVARLVGTPELSGNGREGMVRVLYEMGRELQEFTRTSSGTTIKSKDYEPACAHLRVPRGLRGPGEGARAWVRVMEQDILQGLPVMVLSPVAERFVDVIVGEPKVKAFFCARAGEGALGLTTDVPYTMDDAEASRHRQRAESWAGGGASSRKSGGVVAAGGGLSREARLKVGLLALAGVLVLAIVIAVVARKKGTPAEAEAGEAASNSSAAPEPRPEVRDASGPSTAGSGATTSATGDGDPRSAWGVADALSRVKFDLDRLDAELKADGKVLDPSHREKLADVERRVGLVKAMPWRASSRDQIARDVQTLDEELAVLGRALKAESEGAAAGLSSVLQERARTAPVKHRVLVAAWGTGIAALDPKAGREVALAKVAALEQSLSSVEQQLGDVQAVAAPEAKLIDGAKWSKAAEARLERGLREAADAAVAGNAGRVAGAVEQLRSWNHGADVVAAKAVALEQMLAAGKVLSAEAKPTARELEAAMQASPAYTELGPAVRPLLDQVEAVRSVASLTSHEALISAVKGAVNDGTRTPGAVAAWSRLAELGWPGIPADMLEASRLATSDLEAAINGVADAGQRAALKAQAAGATRAMWTGFVGKAAMNEAGAEAAYSTMGVLGIGDSELVKLPDWARYNLLLAQFRAAAVGKGEGATLDGATRESVARFVAGVEALGATTQQRPEIDALLKGLRPLKDPGAGLEFSKLGPGVLGWTAGAPDAEGGVTYTMKGSERSVHFRRLPVTPSSGGESVAFMSTTEVSVGMFIEVVKSVGKWDDIKPLLATYPATGDTRRGVRVWEWSSSAGEVMRVIKPGKDDFSRGWLRPKASMAGKEFYASGVTVGAPTADMPMQYVSPMAAVVFARVMGCRLPTPEEWKAVAPAEGTPNLRDGTWAKQYEQTKTLVGQDEVKRDPPDFPGAGAFWPAGVTKPQPQADGAAAVEADDGVLWFAPVGSGRQFQHLVGNVSEYVWGDPEGMGSLEASPLKVRTYLGEKNAMGVIGGSALSSKEVPVREASPVNLMQAREGYADVGFRLAFSAPRGAGSAAGPSLSSLLKSAAYMAPEKR